MTAAGYNPGDVKEQIFRVLRYLKTVCGTVVEAGILTVAAFAAYALLLYFAKMIWNVYIATDIGRYYVAAFPIPAQRTTRILGGNLLQFSLGMSILAFIVCIVSAVICRVLHIARTVYMNRGTPGRLIFCGLPLALLVAEFAQARFGLPEWGTAYAYSLVPTLIVFSRCFEMAERLFPEISDVLRGIKNLAGKI